MTDLIQKDNIILQNEGVKYTSKDVVPDTPSVDDYTPIGLCKICNSLYRQEIEEYYDKVRNYSKVHKILAEKYPDFKIHVGSIREHLINHYIQPKQNNLMQKCYAEDVAAWMNIQKDRETSIKRRMAILERELNILASNADGLNLEERRGNAEQVRKLADTLSKYDEQLTEFSNNNVPAKVVLQQFNIIFKDKINSIENAEIKGMLSNVYSDFLDKVSENIGDLTIEEEE